MPKFTRFATHLAKGNARLGADSTPSVLRTLLLGAIPNATQLDTLEFRSQLVAASLEITGTGYTAGGVAQAYTLDALDTANNRQPITYANLTGGSAGTSWTGTISAVGACVYISTGTAATDILVDVIDFGGTVSVAPGNFEVTYNTKFYITCA